MSDPYVPVDLRDCHGRLWRWNGHVNCYQYDDEWETCRWTRARIEAEVGPVTEVLEGQVTR